MPGERLLDLTALGTSAGWSCVPGPCKVFGPGVVEGAHSLGCGTTTRTFETLAPHSKVRIQATVGFIDDWQGETAYLSVGTTGEQDIVWTRSHVNIASGLDVVDGPVPDIVGQPLDVVVAHAASRLTVTFGTTLDCSVEAAFAVGALSLSEAP